MLYEFLKLIQAGKVQSLLEISRILRITPSMALQVADELSRKGYLEKMGADCNTPQTICSKCPMGRNCKALTRHWFLTEKGKTALSRDKANNEI